jgi:hypothetical protein
VSSGARGGSQTLEGSEGRTSKRTSSPSRSQTARHRPGIIVEITRSIRLRYPEAASFAPAWWVTVRERSSSPSSSTPVTFAVGPISSVMARSARTWE